MNNNKNNLRVSVAIPTMNRRNELLRCLASLQKQTLNPLEVIIIDAGKDKLTKREIKKFKELNIKYHSCIPGLEIQRNYGIRKSIGEIIIFVDDDTILDKDYLKEMKSVFEKKENVGGVTGMSVLSDKDFLQKIIHVLDFVYRFIFFLHRPGNGKFQKSGCVTTITSAKNIVPCEFLYGFGMAFRKEIIKHYMFDEKCRGYWWSDDDDIAYRISRKYQNYFNPYAKITHLPPRKKQDANNSFSQKKRIKGFAYYVNKNFPKRIDYKLSFYWAIVGMMIVEFIKGMTKRNLNGFFGFISGLREIISKN